VVKVSDKGQGISAEALPNVFQQFSQGDHDRDTNKSGLGLGLSIVKILVGKHGGTVEAQSEGLGKGSTFTVRLPLKTGDHIPEDSEATVKDNLPLRGIKVMIVEDDNDSREVLQLFLEQCGALVESHSSASSATDHLLRSKGSLPDIIVSDLAMPGEDGYSMISRIRGLPEANGGRLPALALSAFATAESKQKAFDAGFDRYCTKPFEPDILTRDILRLVQNNGSRRTH
jgi:CheY-like chemotaxis protein